RQLVERTRSIPGVDAVGLTTYLPLAGGARFVYFCPEGLACQGVGKDPTTALRQVSADYFSTVRTPVLKGHVFTDRDTASAAPGVAVNETTAAGSGPGQTPVGKHLANSRDMIPREVIGVVSGVKFNALKAANVEEMYMPIEQIPALATTLIVRSTGDPRSLV